jgi:dTDP-glucose 4,6-dehydratase
MSNELNTMSNEPRAMSLLVTGGAGFIGSEFVRQAVEKDYKVIVIDKLTYAGSLKRLEAVKGKYKFYKQDICSKKALDRIFAKEKPDVVINFAAETHVDRSIEDADPFIKTNVEGVQILLSLSRKYNIKRFIQLSTDEVYGEIKEGKFKENDPLKPNSPYSASKAAADLLIRAYIRTYNLPAIIIRPCNNYGKWQYPEKLIPVIITKALKNEKVPVYGKGENIREWLHISDCARAIFTVLEKGKLGEVYNVGSGQEMVNIDLVKKILDILGKPYSLIEFVKDRLGHDYRYCLDSSKIKELGWKAEVDFEVGMQEILKLFKT